MNKFVYLFPESFKTNLRRNTNFYLRYQNGKKKAGFSRISLSNAKFAPKKLDELNDGILYNEKHVGRVIWPLKKFNDPSLGGQIKLPVSDEEKTIDYCGFNS